MLICLFGESCTGKSTLAEALRAETGAELLSGKDYLRLSKNPAEAERLFAARLAACAAGADALIYVTAEPEQLRLLPAGTVRVLLTAGLETIQNRFAARMGGRLPPPVAAMLERRHGQFDGEAHDLHLVSGEQSAEEAAAAVLALCAR